MCVFFVEGGGGRRVAQQIARVSSLDGTMGVVMLYESRRFQVQLYGGGA